MKVYENYEDVTYWSADLDFGESRKIPVMRGKWHGAFVGNWIAESAAAKSREQSRSQARKIAFRLSEDLRDVSCLSCLLRCELMIPHLGW